MSLDFQKIMKFGSLMCKLNDEVELKMVNSDFID